MALPQNSSSLLPPPFGGDFKALSQFSMDSRYLLCATGSTIKFYCCQSGKLLRVLRGHQNEITGLALNPQDPFHQIYSCSRDGTLKLWNYHDAILIRSVDFKKPIDSFAFLFVNDELTIYLALDRQPGGELIKYSPITREREWILNQVGTIALASSKEGNLVVAYFNLDIWVLTVAEQITRIESPNELPVTALAVHNNKDMFAIGDKKGVLFLFEVKPHKVSQVGQFHWHNQEVGGLTFGYEGNVLISGGQESVLVFWYFESDQKEFIPRVGSSGITAITLSPSYDHFAIHFQNNSIKIMDIQSKSLTVAVDGICYLKPKIEKIGPSLVLCPALQSFAYPGQGGTVQFYNPIEDRVMNTLQVGKKPSTKFRVMARQKSRVKHVAFSKNGKWMVTADSKAVFDSQVATLTFWQFDIDSNNYIKNTATEIAHKGEISAILFHPFQDICLSCGVDGHFKKWEPRKTNHATYLTKENLPEFEWACTFTGFYQDQRISAGCFAPDGSLFALAFIDTITLWGPNVGTLRSQLSYIRNESIQTLRILTHSPYMLSATKQHLCLWNLLSCTLEWHLEMDSPIIATDPSSNRYVVSYHGPNDEPIVALFEGAKMVPLHVWKPVDCLVTEVIFFPSKVAGVNSSIYFLDARRQFHLCRLPNDPPLEDPKTEEINLETLEGSSTYQRLRIEGLANVKTVTPDDEDYREIAPSATYMQTLFSGPSHIIPAPSLLFDPFMKSILKLNEK